jgi:hypothetical protein
VLPSTDPFDEANFDAIALLNAYFPTEMYPETRNPKP